MLKLVKLEEKYKKQFFDMMEEWTKSGEEIIPWSICRLDYTDFEAYMKNLEVKEEKDGLVPDSNFFALDTERNIFVGAVNIRHILNEGLLLHGAKLEGGGRQKENEMAVHWYPGRWKEKSQSGGNCAFRNQAQL